MKKSDELHKLEGMLTNLPAFTPRPGLKHELLEKILTEVHREPIPTSKRRWTWNRPAVRVAFSVAGLALSVLLLVCLLPLNTSKRDSGSMSPQLITGAADASKTTDQEIALLKAQREKEMLRQVIPRANGEYVGEGVEITLTTQDPRMAHREFLSDNVESNFDLFRLVQEIYNNGGQLVAINGIPVMPYSEIVSHGTLTEVSDRRIQAPFVIKVIGDRMSLDKKLRESDSALMQLQRKKELAVNVDAYEFVTIDPVK